MAAVLTGDSRALFRGQRSESSRVVATNGHLDRTAMSLDGASTSGSCGNNRGTDSGQAVLDIKSDPPAGKRTPVTDQPTPSCGTSVTVTALIHNETVETDRRLTSPGSPTAVFLGNGTTPTVSPPPASVDRSAPTQVKHKQRVPEACGAPSSQSKGTITPVRNGPVTLVRNGTVTPKTNGGTPTLTSNGTVTSMTNGGTTTLMSSGTVTSMTNGGTTTLTSDGTFTSMTNGGTTTLMSHATVTPYNTGTTTLSKTGTALHVTNGTAKPVTNGTVTSGRNEALPRTPMTHSHVAQMDNDTLTQGQVNFETLALHGKGLQTPVSAKTMQTAKDIKSEQTCNSTLTLLNTGAPKPAKNITSTSVNEGTLKTGTLNPAGNVTLTHADNGTLEPLQNGILTPENNGTLTPVSNGTLTRGSSGTLTPGSQGKVSPAVSTCSMESTASTVKDLSLVSTGKYR